jgi:nitroreductase
MDAIEALKKRRSTRSFSDKPVSRQTLEELIDAARFSPTARNIQPWEFVVITNKDMLSKIAGFTDNGRFIGEAGACVAVFCADTKYYLEDGCAATQTIMVAACALGLDSCWVAGDKKEYAASVSRLLAAPQGVRLVSLIAIGYCRTPDHSARAEKKRLLDMLHWETF